MKHVIKCKKCGKEFIVDCSETNFLKGKYNHYCSISCRNSHTVSDETKLKISKTLKKNATDNKVTRIGICVCCGKKYVKTNASKFCSETCSKLYKQLPTFKKYFGLNTKLIGTLKIFEEVDRIRLMLYNDYWKENLSSTDVAKKYNYPSPCNLPGKIFKYLGIPSKQLKDVSTYNYLKSKHIPVSHKYKSSWHTTWNNKEVFLRSSYETDYAKELDEQQIDYEVELLRIKYWNTQKNEYHYAVPDFYLPNTNMIVEIKSDYTLDIQEMKDKVKAYKNLGYDFKLILNHKETNIESL